jgi:hypothetical protein
MHVCLILFADIRAGQQVTRYGKNNEARRTLMLVDAESVSGSWWKL